MLVRDLLHPQALENSVVPLPQTIVQDDSVAAPVGDARCGQSSPLEVAAVDDLECLLIETLGKGLGLIPSPLGQRAVQVSLKTSLSVPLCLAVPDGDDPGEAIYPLLLMRSRPAIPRKRKISKRRKETTRPLRIHQ